jgi:nitrogen fixation-related uncharacterized protein
MFKKFDLASCLFVMIPVALVTYLLVANVVLWVAWKQM